MFAFLRDRSIAPASRLAFAPSAAFYVLSFTDFCTTALRREPTDDRLQKIVNEQTREEAVHSRWFLEDLTTLAADAPVPLTDALRFL
ncbi:MAG TPA: hypothetical protein VGQ57_10840, partial [Polyangiaceae bacterium]|nr:hypothetical protein [Polyangiaceae bacterium]